MSHTEGSIVVKKVTGSRLGAAMGLSPYCADSFEFVGQLLGMLQTDIPPQFAEAGNYLEPDMLATLDYEYFNVNGPMFGFTFFDDPNFDALADWISFEKHEVGDCKVKCNSKKYKEKVQNGMLDAFPEHFVQILLASYLLNKEYGEGTITKCTLMIEEIDYKDYPTQLENGEFDYHNLDRLIVSPTTYSYDYDFLMEYFDFENQLEIVRKMHEDIKARSELWYIRVKNRYNDGSMRELTPTGKVSKKEKYILVEPKRR